MPIPVTFTNRDLLRGTLVDPGWYKMLIESVGDGEMSKDGGSTNYKVEGVIICDADTGDVKFKDVPVVWNFNSKAMGFASGLFAALGLEIKPDTRYDLKYAEGKTIEVMVERGEYEGKFNNRVNHKYRKPRE